MSSQFHCPQKGSEIIKRFVKSPGVVQVKMSFLPASLYLNWCWRRWENARSQPVTERRDTSCSECRLYDPLLLREIEGNDRADGARDITNPIINSLSSGLDILFIYWYLSLLCMQFVFIVLVNVRVDRSSMNIGLICRNRCHEKSWRLCLRCRCKSGRVRLLLFI